MVDPILSYVAGIGFLVLLIVPVLYLLYVEADTETGDEYPSESVVKGVGPVAEAGGETKADSEAEAQAETDDTGESNAATTETAAAADAEDETVEDAADPAENNDA